MDNRNLNESLSVKADVGLVTLAQSSAATSG